MVDILAAYRTSTDLDPSWYKAWHAWALANSKVAAHYESLQEGEAIPPQVIGNHLVPAVEGKLLPLHLAGMV